MWEMWGGLTGTPFDWLTPAPPLGLRQLGRGKRKIGHHPFYTWVVLIGPPLKSYTLDLMRSTPSLIGSGYPLSLKHQQYSPHKAVYVPAILFNVGVDFERRNLKST